MLIYGHRFIPSHSFFHVSDIDSISNTPPSSVIYIEFNEENLDQVLKLLSLTGPIKFKALPREKMSDGTFRIQEIEVSPGVCDWAGSENKSWRVRAYR